MVFKSKGQKRSVSWALKWRQIVGGRRSGPADLRGAEWLWSYETFEGEEPGSQPDEAHQQGQQRPHPRGVRGKRPYPGDKPPAGEGQNDAEACSCSSDGSAAATIYIICIICMCATLRAWQSEGSCAYTDSEALHPPRLTGALPKTKPQEFKGCRQQQQNRERLTANQPTGFPAVGSKLLQCREPPPTHLRRNAPKYQKSQAAASKAALLQMHFFLTASCGSRRIAVRPPLSNKQ